MSMYDFRNMMIWQLIGDNKQITIAELKEELERHKPYYRLPTAAELAFIEKYIYLVFPAYPNEKVFHYNSGGDAGICFYGNSYSSGIHYNVLLEDVPGSPCNSSKAYVYLVQDLLTKSEYSDSLSFCLSTDAHSPCYFRDNLDGTITDTRNYLMWLKIDDGIKRSREEGKTYIKEFNESSVYKNWRLPRKAELGFIEKYIFNINLTLPLRKMFFVYDDDVNATYFFNDGHWKDAIYSVSSVSGIDGTITSDKSNIMLVRDLLPIKIDRTLSSGWSLFSVPLTLADASPSSFIKDISDNVRIIWGWDAGTWKAYKPDQMKLSVPVLDAIEPGKGYWIYMKESVTATIEGTAP